MAVRYKNQKTGKVATYAQPVPRLEKSNDFERLAEPAKDSMKTAGKKTDTGS